MASIEGSDKKGVKAGARSERRAAALRENLRRRKVQERGRQAEARSTGEPKSVSEKPDPSPN